MRAGLFGGSFDPVHIGHMHVATRALSFVDEVWFLPAAAPPHKLKRRLTPFHHRLNMLQIATRSEPSFRVVDIEASLPVPSYTLKTVEALKKLHPDVDFSLVMGTDTLLELPTWFRAAELVEIVGLVVVERGGFSRGEAEIVLERAFGREVCRRLLGCVAYGDVVDVSSTQIRAALEGGEDVGRLLPDGVMDYIKRHKLYGWKRQ